MVNLKNRKELKPVVKALILSAGKGTRLGELTKSIPKVMIDIGGKPCLLHNIELLKKYGVKEIAINTHYLPQQIKQYFGNGGKWGVKIIYSEENPILGTAGALNNFRDFFNETFFVIYGDVIHQTDLNAMEDFHKAHSGIATLALDNRSQIGRAAVTLKNDFITEFIEKPPKQIPNALVNSGVYLLEPEILDFIPKGFSDFGKDIFPALLRKNKKICGFKGGEVIDVGIPEDLEKARKLFRTRKL